MEIVLKAVGVRGCNGYKFEISKIYTGLTPKDSLKDSGLTEPEMYQKVLEILEEEGLLGIRPGKTLWLLSVFFYKDLKDESSRELIAIEATSLIAKSKITREDIDKINRRAKEIVFEYKFPLK
ncbi:MAG: hypothetical protein Q7S73_02750 [bacterium]|nr:hypothetical protein [bacterium]